MPELKTCDMCGEKQIAGKLCNECHGCIQCCGCPKEINCMLCGQKSEYDEPTELYFCETDNCPAKGFSFDSDNYYDFQNVLKKAQQEAFEAGWHNAEVNTKQVRTKTKDINEIHFQDWLKSKETKQ